MAAAQVRSLLLDEPSALEARGSGAPLLDAFEFVIVDLETTGLGASAGITEIGAVRARDGRIIDEFHTMVDPGHPVPPRITALTGITQSMVEGADPAGIVIPRFLEWAGFAGSEAPILVAHNAPFDTGFLKRAARSAGLEWPAPRVVDTLALARLVLPRPLVRDHRLGTLASYFGIVQEGAHRALEDARTTWGVLSGIVTRLESTGLESAGDLARLSAPVPSRRRSKSALAEGLPRSPGVYRFFDEAGAPLYVGSATNLSSRVRSYFTAAERRASIHRMIDLAAQVRTSRTSTVLEARVLELRDIHELRPLFNRASTHQDCQHWLVLHGDSIDCIPLVSFEEAPFALGPFGTRAHAMAARDAVTRAFAGPDDVLRRAGRLPHGVEEEAGAALIGSTPVVADALSSLMSDSAARGRFEEAASIRSELGAYLAGLDRRRRIVPLALARLAIWAIHRDEGGWEIHAASWGRHFSSVVTPPRTMPTPWIEEILAAGGDPRPGVLLGSSRWSEASVLAHSLDSPQARLVHWDGGLPRGESPFSPLSRTRLLALISEAESAHPRFIR